MYTKNNPLSRLGISKLGNIVTFSHLPYFVLLPNIFIYLSVWDNPYCFTAFLCKSGHLSPLSPLFLFFQKTAWTCKNLREKATGTHIK